MAWLNDREFNEFSLKFPACTNRDFFALNRELIFVSRELPTFCRDLHHEVRKRRQS
jgi:hypothetical protein